MHATVEVTPSQYLLSHWLISECWQDRDGWPRLEFLLQGFRGPEPVVILPKRQRPEVKEIFIEDFHQYWKVLELVTTRLGVSPNDDVQPDH